MNRSRLFAFGLTAGLFCSQAYSNADSTPDASGRETKPTFWLIPHTHWEGAVFKTREEYLEMGLSHILTVLRLLNAHPNYRFTLDQVAYFRPFLERYPEEAEAFRKFVKEGRLQIVCGLNIMPDDNMPSGESFVRQILYAKGYCRRELGTEVTVGWLLDTFGHHAQLPQIFSLAGYKSFWFARGVEDRARMPSEFLWRGIDGTDLLSVWLPFSYGYLYAPPREINGFTDFMKQHWLDLAPFSRVRDRVGLAGVDVSEPELYVPELTAQFNRNTNREFLLKIGGPADFEASISNHAGLPVISGERNPLFQGIYSSRIELKQRMRQTERLLISAEKMGVVAQWLGMPPDEMIWRAWEPALFNVTHDLASGVMTDGVYEDTLRGYDFSQKLGEQLLDSRLERIIARINTKGSGIALVVFNTLGWSRTDFAQGDVGFAEAGIQDFELVDETGSKVANQVQSAEHFEDGGLRRVKFGFVARDVPALGHRVYHVQPLWDAARSPTSELVTNGVCQFENLNSFVKCDVASGTLTSLRLKNDDWEALSAPANRVALESDQGDFWELYRNLDGGQSLIMTRPLQPPQSGKARFSDEEPAKSGTIRLGPVFSEVQVTHPLGSNGFSTRIRVYKEMDRIDFETRIVNRDKFVRYRLLVPTSIINGRNFQEIPFGAIERPMSQEFPAQNWIDYSDNARGVALLNRGMPGNNISEGTLMLSLLRSTRIQSYGIGGGFEGQGSDTGLELGKELTLEYSIFAHAGDWRQAGSYRAGMEFNHPLIVRKSISREGPLPALWGLLEISPSNVVLSALKPSTDGETIVRVYEASGATTSGAKIKLNTKVVSAHLANLMEDTTATLRVTGNSILFDLHPFEIKTFKFQLAGLRQPNTQ